MENGDSDSDGGENGVDGDCWSAWAEGNRIEEISVVSLLMRGERERRVETSADLRVNVFFMKWRRIITSERTDVWQIVVLDGPFIP